MKMKKITLKQREILVGSSGSGVYFLYSLLFWFYPFMWLLVLTFSKWKFAGTPTFNGIENIKLVLKNEQFWISIKNTFRFMAFYLPIVLVLSSLFAVGLKKLKYGKSFVALAFFISSVSSGVAYSLVFSKIFSESGPINRILLDNFGVMIPWFTNPNIAMLTVAIMVAWKMIGYYGLILYAGLEAIPNSYYEAAELDGAIGIKKFFKITLPLINSQLIMILVAAITISFGIFTEPFVITGGGPMQSTITPMTVMYDAAFKRVNPTFAATMSIFIAIISYSMIKISRKLVEREVEII